MIPTYLQSTLGSHFGSYPNPPTCHCHCHVMWGDYLWGSRSKDSQTDTNFKTKYCELSSSYSTWCLKTKKTIQIVCKDTYNFVLINNNHVNIMASKESKMIIFHFIWLKEVLMLLAGRHKSNHIVASWCSLETGNCFITNASAIPLPLHSSIWHLYYQANFKRRFELILLILLFLGYWW